jgi:hypothetical protein
MNSRLAIAMASYAVLALLGTVTLTGNMRTALWIFLGGLAAKTLMAAAARRGE